MKAVAVLYNDKKEPIGKIRVDGRTAPHGFGDYMKWNYRGSWAIAYVKLRGRVWKISN
jgi:hypothetical protein